jgi:hypothetical protein
MDITVKAKSDYPNNKIDKLKILKKKEVYNKRSKEQQSLRECD